jgi:hypothetical protein
MQWKCVRVMYDQGSVAAETLCYKPEGHGFETRRGERYSPLYLILPAALGPGVCSASNRKQYQKQKNNVFGEQRAAGA